MEWDPAKGDMAGAHLLNHCQLYLKTLLMESEYSWDRSFGWSVLMKGLERGPADPCVLQYVQNNCVCRSLASLF